MQKVYSIVLVGKDEKEKVLMQDLQRYSAYDYRLAGRKAECR